MTKKMWEYQYLFLNTVKTSASTIEYSSTLSLVISEQ